MADAIGSVRATFTASSSGMTGAIDQIVGKLGSFAAATKRTQAQTVEYNKIVGDLYSQFFKGSISAEEYAERVGRIQGKFKGVSEAERMRIALDGFGASLQGTSRYGEDFSAEMEKIAAGVRAATPPLERLTIGLAENRADFLSGKKSADEYRNTIATLPGEVNGTETAQARMDRIFKQSQETMRGLRGPTAEYDDELRQLKEQLDAGFISDTAYAEATAKVAEKMREADPAAKALAEAMEDGKRITQENLTPLEKYDQEITKLKERLAQGAISEETFARASKKAKDTLDGKPQQVKSVGDAFGGLPGPLGAAARAFDMMQKSLSGTMEGFRSGGISGGISNFVGQIRAGVSNAGSTGGASLVGVAPQIALVATAAYAGVEALKRMTAAMGEVGARVERTSQLADRLGISFQQYEILAAAANMAGVETEALAAAQTRGLKAISAARDGAGEEAKAFEALGISQQMLNDSSPAALLEMAAAKLQAIEDPATRAALAVKIFGKSGNEVLPALQNIDSVRQGIQRLGGVMNEADQMRFTALDDAFDNAARATTRLGETLLAPFTGLFETVAEGVAATFGGIASALAPLTPLVDGLLKPIGFVVQLIGEGIGIIGRFVGATITGVYGIVEGVAEIVSYSEMLGPIFDAVGSIATFIKDTFLAIGAGIGEWISRLEAITGIEIMPIKAGADAESIEAQRKAEEDAKKAADEARKSDEARAKSIRDGLVTPTQQYQRGIEEANRLYDDGLLTLGDYMGQIAKLNSEYQKADPAIQAQLKAQEEQEKVAADLAAQVERAATAGLDLGAAAAPIRAAFDQTAAQIRDDFSRGFIDADEAKAQMGDAVDEMNKELKRLGEDQKFAEKIREGFKSETDKIKDELAAIDSNQTLSTEEKERAKGQVRDKFVAGLPGAAEKDAADKFREDQDKLKAALDAGLIDKDQFRERQGRIREELESSVSDLRDKQERNAQPDRRAVGAVDVNSSEGAATFFRLLRGQDDPTRKQLDEMRKQTRLLERVAEAEAEVVQI